MGLLHPDLIRPGQELILIRFRQFELRQRFTSFFADQGNKTTENFCLLVADDC